MLKHANAYKCIQMHAFAGKTNTKVKVNTKVKANTNVKTNIKYKINTDAYSFYTLTYKKRKNYHTKKPSDFRRLIIHYLILSKR